MKQYSVKITDKALADMESIYQYIATELQVPATALRHIITSQIRLNHWRQRPSAANCLIRSPSMTGDSAKGWWIITQ